MAIKRFFYILLPAFAFVFLTACQKEVQDGSVPQVKKDSIYLYKYVGTDTTYPSGLDTFAINLYSYDNQKRLSQIDYTGFQNGTHDLLGTLTTRYYYNGADTVPFKQTTESLFPNSGEHYFDTVFFYYNTQQLIAKDSFIRYSPSVMTKKNVTTFVNAGGNRYLIKHFFLDPATNNTILTADSIFSSFSTSAGNILTSYDSVYNLISGSLDAVTKYAFTYDNKKNPFQYLNLPYPTFTAFFAPGYEYGYKGLVSANNYTNLVYIFASPTSNINQTTQVIYEYNDESYPAIIRYINPTGSNKRKEYLFYKK